jgi:hypothetical protein
MTIVIYLLCTLLVQMKDSNGHDSRENMFLSPSPQLLFFFFIYSLYFIEAKVKQVGCHCLGEE